jgi:hypothetical protein
MKEGKPTRKGSLALFGLNKMVKTTFENTLKTSNRPYQTGQTPDSNGD